MPASIKSIFRIVPQSLFWQLSVPLLIAFLATGWLLWHNIDTLVQQQRSAVVQTVQHAARAVKSIQWGTTTSAHDTAEQALLQIARFPLQRVAIVDRQGKPEVSAERLPDGETYLRFDATDLPPPNQRAATLTISVDQVVYWQPITRNGQSGDWLRINASLEHITQWRDEQLVTTAVWFAAIVVISLLGVMWLARNTVHSIIASARFANGIAGSSDTQLAHTPGCSEMRYLQNALNRLAKHWHHRLALSEQATQHLRMHKVAIDAHAAVCITDGAGRIQYVNNQFCLLSGYQEAELVGGNIGLLNSGQHDTYYFKNLWRTLALGRIWQGNLCNRHKQGGMYWVHCTIAPIMDHTGRPCQYLAVQTAMQTSAPAQSTLQTTLGNVASRK